MAESLVALRDRREQVISRLSDGYARDLFDVDELERRLDLAHGARSVAELDQLVSDLGEPVPSGAASTCSCFPAHATALCLSRSGWSGSSCRGTSPSTSPSPR